MATVGSQRSDPAAPGENDYLPDSNPENKSAWTHARGHSGSDRTTAPGVGCSRGKVARAGARWLLRIISIRLGRDDECDGRHADKVIVPPNCWAS
jgi:hypothetical protein